MTTLTAPRLVPPLVASRYRRALYWAPLSMILLAQAALSVRLLHLYPASSDESLYIYSGHQLIHELWHGGGSPYYEEWLSGAPVLYPVLAAVADHLGGLTEVRLMSLCFMLIATGLLYGTARRLFGYWPAVTSAALFGGLGITQGLGVLGTYDALSLMIIAVAAYCAVRAADGDRAVPWLLFIVPVLALANWVKYASLLFDPVVIGLAALSIRRLGWDSARRRAVALTTALAVVLGVSLYLAGSGYLNGIMFTTLARKGGAQAIFGAKHAVPAGLIVLTTWDLIGLVIALSGLALFLAFPLPGERSHVPVLAMFLVAGMLVTFEALHLHNIQAISKHDDFGAWFTCIAGGYGLARGAELTRSLRIRASIAAAAIAVASWSAAYYSSRPIAGGQAVSDIDMHAIVALRPYLALPKGRFLLGGLVDYRMLYDDRISIPWWQFSDDVYIKYPVPGREGDWQGQARGLACGAPGQPAPGPACVYLEGTAGYQAAIHAHAFSLVSMVGDHGLPQDKVIERAVERTPGYVLLTRIGGAPTWIYRPAYRRLTHARSPR